MTTTEQTTSQTELYTRIASELSLRAGQVERTVALLLDDATVPFIARYRKEITGNLDEETGELVLNLLLELTRSANKTLIMATHNPEVVPLADRVYTIHDGQLARES